MNHAFLKEYIPENSISIIENWFNNYSFDIVISNHRKSKLGDFRAGNLFTRPRISVNSSLNSYAFLITLTHEFAHLLVWKKYKSKVRPHGKEWKNTFSNLLSELIQNEIFPEPVNSVLIEHKRNPPASSLRDKNLIKALNYFNENPSLYLYELEEGDIFKLNGQTFIKGTKRRTRYLCLKASTKQKYLINEMAEISVENNSN